MGSAENAEDPIQLCNELELSYAVSEEATITVLLTAYCMVTIGSDDSIIQYAEKIGSFKKKLLLAGQTYNDQIRSGPFSGLYRRGISVTRDLYGVLTKNCRAAFTVPTAKKTEHMANQSRAWFNPIPRNRTDKPCVVKDSNTMST